MNHFNGFSFQAGLIKFMRTFNDRFMLSMQRRRASKFNALEIFKMFLEKDDVF